MKIRVGFGFGVAAGADIGGERFLALLDACERLGWDSIWFSERVTGGLLDPLAAMAAAAARTRRLKFGPSVLVLPGRNPVLLAKELATIDVISDGRLVVAVGLGAPVPADHAALGVPRTEAAARTEEAVVLMKRLWTEDGVTHEGRFFSVRGASVGPRPAQRPHPDVWFGGHSTAALGRTGRVGDGWLPSFVTPGEYKAKADVVREVAAAAGRAVDDEHYGALVPYIPGGTGVDPAAVLTAVAARRPDAAPEEVVALDGARALRDRLEAFAAQGASKFVVVPAVPPRDWDEELARLRAEVAAPLET